MLQCTKYFVIYQNAGNQTLNFSGGGPPDPCFGFKIIPIFEVQRLASMPMNV